jgi:hypothetical protein
MQEKAKTPTLRAEQFEYLKYIIYTRQNIVLYNMRRPLHTIISYLLQ